MNGHFYYPANSAYNNTHKITLEVLFEFVKRLLFRRAVKILISYNGHTIYYACNTEIFTVSSENLIIRELIIAKNFEKYQN